MADTQHKDDDASNRKCKWATNAMHMHKKWKRLNCREKDADRDGDVDAGPQSIHKLRSNDISGRRRDGPHEIWLNIVNAKSYERLTGGRPKKSVFGAMQTIPIPVWWITPTAE